MHYHYSLTVFIAPIRCPYVLPLFMNPVRYPIPPPTLTPQQTVMASTRGHRDDVDSKCRDRTASWVRQRAALKPGSVETCEFYDNYEKVGWAS